MAIGEWLSKARRAFLSEPLASTQPYSGDELIHILFVQNCPIRGITAIEAFKPDAKVSELHVVQELEAIQFLRRAGPFSDCPEPGLIVLDIEMPRKIQKAISKELRQSRRKSIPVVRLDHVESN